MLCTHFDRISTVFAKNRQKRQNFHKKCHFRQNFQQKQAKLGSANYAKSGLITPGILGGALKLVVQHGLDLSLADVEAPESEHIGGAGRRLFGAPQHK